MQSYIEKRALSDGGVEGDTYVLTSDIADDNYAERVSRDRNIAFLIW